MKYNRSAYHFAMTDFLLYMEAGRFLPQLVRMPQINRYVFDVIVRNLDDQNTSISYDAAGPLQVTNIFIKEYLKSGSTDEAIILIEELSNVNEQFSRIPLYQLQSVCGFLNRHLTQAEDRLLEQPSGPLDESSLGQILPFLAGTNLEKYLSTVYKKYFGASNDNVNGRIAEYCANHYSTKQAFFVDSYAISGAWDV